MMQYIKDPRFIYPRLIPLRVWKMYRRVRFCWQNEHPLRTQYFKVNSMTEVEEEYCQICDRRVG